MIWIIFAVLMSIVTVMVAVRTIRKTICIKKGHRWQYTDTGARCRRCKRSLKTGDN